jgi:hypothetical protein
VFGKSEGAPSRSRKKRQAVADSFNKGANMQYRRLILVQTKLMKATTTDKKMTPDSKVAAKVDHAHKAAPASGCFGFTKGDLAPRRHDEIDANLFARCYSDSYLISEKRNLPRPKKES